jgi:membrane fusion protein, heavy metal efflux system
MRPLRLSWPVVTVSAIALVLAGAGGTYLWLSQRPGTASAGVAPAAPTRAPAADVGPLPDAVITLADEAAAKAGIVVSPVTMGNSAGTMRLSGVVAPNAYREVIVTPLVSGRVTRIAVTLGERVARGALLAEIHSPDLAEAQTRYLSVRAQFQAVEQEIARTTRLAEIGAASRQELERIHAEHVRHRTEVETARARLQLLGMSPRQIDALTDSGQVAATTTVASPIAGVVTARAANPGSTVDAATPLLTIVDLSSVWVVGDLYERDFAAVAIGTPVIVTTTAYPDEKVAGRVAYIDPQVRADTRTAQIRVEVPNPGQRLRLGMYAEVLVETAAATRPSILIPRSAVQNVADRTVVYLADPAQPGRFIEREVTLGQSSGDQIAILSGVGAGDRIVVGGSFSLRAERERLGLRPPR